MNEVWKLIYLARRNPALAAEDFPQAWREHSALGRQCKNVGQRVKAVAQCSRQLAETALPLSQDYDGVNLMVLAEREAGAVIWTDPETLAVMRPDELRVFDDYVRNFSMLCRQQLLHDRLPPDALPQNGQVLLIGFLQRQDDWQPGDALLPYCPELWRAGGLAHATRIVCNTVDEEPPAGYGYRYIVEWWFESVQQARAALQSVSMNKSEDSFSWGESVWILTAVTHSRP